MKNPKYPVYVISKGRWEQRLTVKSLESIKVDYRVVIEPQEFDQYASVINKDNILVLPFSNLGLGSIPARNWVWEHSIAAGFNRHWILDDNIRGFFRFNNNSKIKVNDGSFFAIMEHFTDRYENVPMAGPNYYMFAVAKHNNLKPYTPNTRVYSCILLSNKVPHRWRGRYNEDTDLSIRFLKDGYCTVLFNAFLCGKSATMTMKGGNTDELYKTNSHFDGRLEMAKSLAAQHPDVCVVSQKWGRYQHHVDYSSFKANRLIRKPEFLKLNETVNNHGMKLLKKD